jgi:membrane fusion protein (multidrug efflux system)
MVRKLASWLAGIVLLTHGELHAAPIKAGELDCLIEPHEIVNLSSPVEGVLEKVYVDRGAYVKKGQVVAQLESNLEQATVVLARARAHVDAAIKSSAARLEFSKIKLARSEKLFEKQLISAADLDEAQTEKRLAEMALLNATENRRLAELELDRANVALSRHTIRSPISGVVVERFLSPGEYTSGQFKNDSPILKLAQIDPLRVEVFAPVSLRGKIFAGMPAKLMLEAPTNASYDVRVSVVDRVVDSASGTFRVRSSLPNPTHRIPPGVKCKINLFPSEKPLLKTDLP